MISIIICSRNQFISDTLFQNIKGTISCEYELIVIDNSENKYSIFEAYNLGIEKSTFEFLCFIHDDILFHTVGWGNVVQRIFSENQQIGLLGIAGAKVKSKTPSAWWHTPKNQIAMNIIQHFNDGTIATQSFGFASDSIQEVVTIDGVFMVMRKNKNIHFSNELKGFHNYDLNICFEFLKNGYKISVTNAILVEHFSTGATNKAWVDSTFKIHKIYNKILPLSLHKIYKDKNLEVINANRFIKKCLLYNRNSIAFSVWTTLFFRNPISKFHFTFWKKIIQNKLGYS